MSRRPRRRWWLPAALGFLAVGDGPTPGQGPQQTGRPAVTSVFDPRLEPIRRAAPSWESRQGPPREIVDQVCLVPDLPTFLEAVASWDQGHFFPVLFDDVESSFRFIRAFKPARIIRMPKSGPPFPASQTWERAVDAVGSSWTAGSDRARGDLVPKSLGATPPGVVVSSPDAPMLAGAVALAAGRFQPLLRLDSDKRFGDVLSLDEAVIFARSVADKVGEKVPDMRTLGDDCDFLTIAGDYPYRYREPGGAEDAVDDRIGREPGEDRRWAFAGRLLGDAVDSTYRAMCSLFLQPESALMFNGYDEGATPWSFFEMRTAALRLSGALPTSQVSGEPQANLAGWHETFDPSNRFGLILINSHGSPTEFNIRGGPAHAPDIPQGVPSAVLMIHSFSAADPLDSSTIAGRWLANGAFVFFGSINEPFLEAFRLPRVVGEMIAQRWPLVVAARQMAGESRGNPWRLVFLGDPLYRIKTKAGAGTSPRLDRWEPTARWPAYSEGPRPASGSDVDLLFWSLKVALARLQGTGRGPTSPTGEDLVETLLAIRRGSLPTNFRRTSDALLTEVLLEAKKRTALTTRLLAVPESERSSGVRRAIETLLVIEFQLGLARDDASKTQAAWLELMKTGAVREFKQQATARVGRLARTSAQLGTWRTSLQAALKTRPGTPDSEIISGELKRVEEALKAAR